MSVVDGEKHKCMGAGKHQVRMDTGFAVTQAALGYVMTGTWNGE